MFKKSSKKKYERQFAQSDFLLSDVPRDETPKEEAHSKCMSCGYFCCQCERIKAAAADASVPK
jgi:hypothetical protein